MSKKEIVEVLMSDETINGGMDYDLEPTIRKMFYWEAMRILDLLQKNNLLIVAKE